MVGVVSTNSPNAVAKFLVPDVIFGTGVLCEVGQATRRQGGVHVLVVSDPGVAEAGWTGEVLGHLAAAGVSTQLWDGLTPNPKGREVTAGCAAYLEGDCDVLVAVGGGSCIDAAKAIAVLASRGGSIADYAGVGKVEGPLPPTVMVPTTGGSGSDVSQFCVVTDTARRLKITIGARALVADISVTDPRALTTVPHDITAYTAIDVLSHAIESYVSKAASFLTDTHALAAIRGVCEYLLPALDRPGDICPREGLARASLQAGLAFTNALLGATHAISHQIGGMTDLPHGLLNAILLPHVMEFNAAEAADRLADIAAVMGLRTGLMTTHEAADAAIQTVRTFGGKAGLPATLREVGVGLSELGEVARNSLSDAYLVTNPRKVSEEDALAICQAAWLRRLDYGGLVMTELDETRLAQLVGLRSSKIGYYAQWRGIAQDLERALAGWTEAEQRAAELTRRNEQLRRAREQLARVRQAELVHAERHRIARDLHDSVAQCLVGIGMHLEWCHRNVDPGSPAYERLVASKELARAGLGWVRSAVAELSGLEYPGTGLGQALRDLAADFRAAGQLQVSVRVSGRQRQLPAAVEHALFQVAQEGLWNIVRHAGATQAWLSLAYADGQIRLSVSDDGRGDPAATGRYLTGANTRHGGHGLRNIAERAAELGGDVALRRRRGGGLRISVRVPAAAGAEPGDTA
jgi:alcohol dehydrogenase